MTDELDEALDELNGEQETTVGQLNYPSPFDKPLPDNHLGHIVAQDTGLKVGRDENVMYAVIHPNERGRVETGDYIRVPYYRPDNIDEEGNVEVEKQLLASVNSLSYETELDDKRFTGVDSFGAEQYTFLAEMSPIAVITLDENWDDNENVFEAEFVSKPPRPTVRLDTVEQKEFLRCGLDVPRDGIYVGDIAVNGKRVPSSDNPLEYYLFNPNATDETSGKGEPTIFRHLLVAGSTGTGKTHTSKNILRQFSKCKKYNIDVPAEEQEKENIKERTRGLNITVIDPEDEYTELGQDPEDENMERAKELAEKRSGLEYGAIGDQTNFQIFAPNTGDSSTKELNTGSNEVIDFGIPFEIVKHHRKLMMPNDPQGPTRQLINRTLNDYFNKHNEPYSYDEFDNWFHREKTQYSDMFSDNIIDAAGRRITGREAYESVFDTGSNGFLDDDVLQTMFSPNQVSVITTGHLRGQTQNLVVQAISSYVVESKISSNPDSTLIKGTPMILALDEAHEYVQEPETTREFFIVNKFRRAARRGRKDKFGLYFISQNPADIDGEVRNQINTKVYMQLDRRVVNEPDVYVPPEFSNQLPKFDKGQMVVVQPDVNPVELVGLDTCLTRHSK